MSRGCELRIKWQTQLQDEQDDAQSDIDARLCEQELTKYPVIGVHWSKLHDAPPNSFVSICAALLSTFNGAIRWDLIEPDAINEIIDCIGTNED